MAFERNSGGRGPTKGRGPSKFGAAGGARGSKPYGERKSFSDRAERPARASKPYASGASKTYGERAARPSKPYGERPARSTEGRSASWSDRADRPAKPYADRPVRAPYGERSARPAKPYGDRESFSDRAERPARAPNAARENRGVGAQAKFNGKRAVKHSRVVSVGEDGWLIGHHTVLAALSAGRRKVREVWLLAEAKGDLATLLAAHPEWPVSIKSRPDFDTQFGDMVHQGVAALVGNLSQPSLPELLATKPQLVVALDQITDPHNLGAIVRSSAAFGAAAVLVTEHRAAGLNATAAKAAAGAMEAVPVVEVTNLVQSLTMLQENGFKIIGLAGEAEQLLQASNGVALRGNGPICLVLGSEGEGLRRLTRESCDLLVRIPMAPTVESLNVSVAAGVALALLNQPK